MDRFLVSIGEERDWHLGFPRACWSALLPLLLTVFCSVMLVGVPQPKPRGLGEWSMLTAGLADGPETGVSPPSPTEELRWAGTSHSSSEGCSSAGSSSQAPSSICSVQLSSGGLIPSRVLGGAAAASA